MPHRTGPTNPELKNLIKKLKQEGYGKSRFLLRLANELERSARQRREVSLSSINRVAKEGETVVVPGKVLDGKIEKKVIVACWKISSGARNSLEKIGGKAISIDKLIESKKVARIIG